MAITSLAPYLQTLLFMIATGLSIVLLYNISILVIGKEHAPTYIVLYTKKGRFFSV